MARIAFAALALVAANAYAQSATQSRHDLTGVFVSPNGAEAMVVQNGDTLTWSFDNAGFVHRFEGRYVSPTEVIGIQRRFNRSNLCEARMQVKVDVVDRNQLCATSTLDPPGTAQCDLPGSYSERSCVTRR
jgi:hypothetical protein